MSSGGSRPRYRERSVVSRERDPGPTPGTRPRLVAVASPKPARDTWAVAALRDRGGSLLLLMALRPSCTLTFMVSKGCPTHVPAAPEKNPAITDDSSGTGREKPVKPEDDGALPLILGANLDNTKRRRLCLVSGGGSKQTSRVAQWKKEGGV